MESVEKTGETIESAIDAGLRELGVTAADVMVEVLEEPNRGVFGIGAKPARVRIIYMGRRPEPPAPVQEAKPASTGERERGRDNRNRDERRPSNNRNARNDNRNRGNNRVGGNERGFRNDTGNRVAGTSERPERSGRNDNRNRGGRRDSYDRGGRDTDDYGVSFDDPEELDFSPKAEVIPDEQADELALVGKQLLNELLEKMDILGNVTIHKSESTREGEETLWILNIGGEDAQPLIGRRGDTLASLQYILRLMLSRQLQRRANIIVDVMEFKLRRNDRLKQLATRMADQAVKQGRTVTLEPMPPNERRIIHLTLKEREDVETKSIGEGSSRKVTINPVGL
jgi:spoIIIJ-associated protein